MTYQAVVNGTVYSIPRDRTLAIVREMGKKDESPRVTLALIHEEMFKNGNFNRFGFDIVKTFLVYQEGTVAKVLKKSYTTVKRGEYTVK